jgi:hypothetical protein
MFIKKLFKKVNPLLLAILLVGFFLRIYKPAEFFMYSHDQDLAGWFVRDVINNHHLRLIGQETSTRGIFIGPLYYYLLIPFYLLFGMDPMGGVVMILILGIFCIWSFYYVFSKVVNEKSGLIASFLYAVSFYTIFNDREVVPTMPVILWTVWYFYGLNRLLVGKQKRGFLILSALTGLIWHLNMTLILLVPLIPLSLWLSKKKVVRKNLKGGLVLLLLFSLPLVLFETRHNFSQVRSFYISLTTHQDAITSGFEKFMQVILLMGKNADGLIWGSIEPFTYKMTFYLLVLASVFLVDKKAVKKKYAIVFLGWLLLYIGFFSVYSKNLSEYYLNGTIVLWIFVLTTGISYLISKKGTRKYGYLFLVLFAAVNLHQFFTIKVNKSGYLYRKAIVQEIKKDSREMNYPCVAVSYITKPGYDLGYRYLFFLEEMHVNQPSSSSPVYTVVYPLRRDIEVDRTFGIIGLIYPEYSSYTREGIIESCSGANSNLTDPLFGFTN